MYTAGLFFLIRCMCMIHVCNLFCVFVFFFFSFNDLSKLRCGIDEMIREFVPYQGPGGGLHPTVDKLILPWAGISPLAWNMKPGKLRLACPESSPGKTGNKK